MKDEKWSIYNKENEFILKYTQNVKYCLYMVY